MTIPAITDARTVTAGSVSLRPSNEGFAQIGHRFANQIIEDVRKARKDSDTLLLVELIKIAGELRIARPDLLARLLVAIEQSEPIMFPDAPPPITIGVVLEAISRVCPGASVDQDNDGQLIIYTDMRVPSEDNAPLVPFEVV